MMYIWRGKVISDPSNFSRNTSLILNEHEKIAKSLKFKLLLWNYLFRKPA